MCQRRRGRPQSDETCSDPRGHRQARSEAKFGCSHLGSLPQFELKTSTEWGAASFPKNRLNEASRVHSFLGICKTSLPEEDFTSRARLTRAGSVIVLKNVNGCYAALKVRSGEAKDRRRGSCLSMSLTRIAARIFQRRTNLRSSSAILRFIV